MSAQPDNLNYGFVNDREFIPKNAIQIRNDIIANARQFFGDDIARTPGEPLVNVYEANSLEIELLWQIIDRIISERSILSATGIQLIELARERGVEQRDAIKAETRIKFTVIHDAIVTVAALTVITNTPGSDTTIEYETTEERIFPIQIVVKRHPNQAYDVFSAQSGYQKFQEIQTVNWIRDDPDDSDTEYLSGYQYNTYSANDDKITWIRNSDVNEPSASAYYYPVCTVVLKITNHSTGSTDSYNPKMTDYDKWSPLDDASGAAGVNSRTYHVIWVRDDPDNPATEYDPSNYNVLSSAAAISWSGATSEPASTATYYMKAQIQRYIQHGSLNGIDSLDPGDSTDVEDVVAVYDVAETSASNWVDPIGVPTLWSSQVGKITDYTQGPGNDLIQYVDADNELNWLPGDTPDDNALYYVFISGISSEIISRARVAGRESNVNAGDLNTLASPITGVTNVNNEADVTSGLDLETDAELRMRTIRSIYARMNDEYLSSQIANIQGIFSTRVIEEAGKFQITIASSLDPIPQYLYDIVLAAVNQYKPVGVISTAIVRIQHGSTSIDYFPEPYISVLDIEWVADNPDGSNPYDIGPDSSTDDVDIFKTNTNYIYWWGNSEPTLDNFYFVKMHGVVGLAEVITIDVNANIILSSEDNIIDIEASVQSDLESYFNALKIGDDISIYKISDIIADNNAVDYTSEIVLTAVIKLRKVATKNIDFLHLSQLTNVQWISDVKSGTGPYIHNIDYYWMAEAFDVQRPSGTSSVLSVLNDRLQIWSDDGGGEFLELDLDFVTYPRIIDIVNGIDLDPSFTVNINTNIDATTPSTFLDKVQRLNIRSSPIEIRVVDHFEWVQSPPNRPSDGSFYYAKVDFVGDLEIKDDEIARLGTLTLTEAS